MASWRSGGSGRKFHGLFQGPWVLLQDQTFAAMGTDCGCSGFPSFFAPPKIWSCNSKDRLSISSKQSSKRCMYRNRMEYMINKSLNPQYFFKIFVHLPQPDPPGPCPRWRRRRLCWRRKCRSCRWSGLLVAGNFIFSDQ